MRVRIIKPSTGIVDGVSLSHLLPGLIYEVAVSLGTWLISQGVAEEDVRAEGEIVDPPEHTSTVVTGGGVTVSITYREDDHPPRRRRTNKEP